LDKTKDEIISLKKELSGMRSQMPILIGWGGAGCVATVNGSALLSYQDKYNVSIACGIEDQTKDRFEDKDITISPPFTI
jgi:hypothetical protein